MWGTHNGRVKLFAPETTIRVRILWTMVLLVVIALVSSGSLVVALQSAHLHRQVDDDLKRITDEIRVLATQGKDPTTGAPFASPEALLRSHLERNVLEAGHSEIAYIDARLRWLAPESVPLRPENDPELLDVAEKWVSGDQTLVDTVHTSKGTYRLLVVPVRAGERVGALVHVVDLDNALSGLRSTMLTYVLVGVGMSLVVAAVAHSVVGRLLRPIGELRDATESIDESDLTSRVPVRGHDDLAALAASFNRMLDRVQEASKAQSALLDDVGHELRTPLTVLRGHLELLDVHDVEDVRQTRDLLLDEAARMGRLVEDILLLAKAERADFIRPAPLRLAELTDRVFDKALAMGKRQWNLESIADVTICADAARITQAWLQLVDNAVKYSAENSRISLGSRLVEDHAIMWVRDEGIGISAEDMKTIRGRFTRTREAARLAHGTGLGLGIVESIMTAHGGDMQISSQVGVGSVFTLRLALGENNSRVEVALPESSSPQEQTTQRDTRTAGISHSEETVRGHAPVEGKIRTQEEL